MIVSCILAVSSWRSMQKLLDDAANLRGRLCSPRLESERHTEGATRLRFADGHALHPVNGNRNQKTALKRAQTRWLPAPAISFSTVLLLPALAALLGCSLVSLVSATPLPDGTSADEVPVEDADFTPVDCCAHTATLLQDIAVLQRSLSQCADSLAASAARALGWERTAKNLQLENAALRSPLEAPPSLKEMPTPTAAGSLIRSSSTNTSQLSPDAGSIRYPATLPVSGAQPAGDWHGFSQRWHAGAYMSVARVPGFCSRGDERVSSACDRGRGYPLRSCFWSMSCQS